jgi:hypothetical protein
MYRKLRFQSSMLETGMSGPMFLAGTDDPVPAFAVACLNLFVALALVSISLFLGLAVSILALLARAPRWRKIQTHHYQR